jgi:hypothetical protein
VSCVDEAGELAAVDSLRQSAMEEDILDVELMDRQVLGEGEGENGTNNSELDDGALGEGPEDLTGLVVDEGANRSQLVAKEPLTLVPGGHDTRSQVWLASRATYFSSIVRRQCGSARAVRTEEGNEEAYEGVAVVSAGRWVEEHRQPTESPWGGRARGHDEWRPGGTPAAQNGMLGRRGPQARSTCGSDRRRRGRQSGPRSSTGPGPEVPREWCFRDGACGVAMRGAVGVVGATRGAGKRASRGVGVDGAARGRGRGAGIGARRGAGGEGVIGSDSRRESRSVGGEEPARGNMSSSKTT